MLDPAGTTIEGVLTTPPASVATPPYKLLLYPHGGPHSRSTEAFNFLVEVFAAHGYAVFPEITKGAIGIGGAQGDGTVFEEGSSVGSSTMTQVTIGLQLGGQSYSEVVFFQDQASFDDFKRGRLKLDTQASAVALTARAAADVGYRKGVAIVTLVRGGLMYEASVGGQKFSFEPVAGE